MLALIFILGLVIGSFINCLVYRLNREKNLKSLVLGRSYCPKCRKGLDWYDNIPVLSFVFLRGHCRHCHQQIAYHYPLVEIVTAVLSVVLYYFSFLNSGSWLLFSYQLFLLYVFIALFVSDLLYFTLPDLLIYPSYLVVGIYLISKGEWTNFLVGIVTLLFFLFLVLVTRFKGMGLGDVKLAFLMGLFLGFPKTLVALFLAFLTGALAGVILILLGKKKLKSRIPFGPFLVLGSWLAFFWADKIWPLFL